MQEAAFTTLIQDHLALIHKVARAYARDDEDRRDVVQEIVVGLWRSRMRFDPRFQASTWIYRVALNVAISFYRRERRHHQARDRAADVAIIDAGRECRDGRDRQLRRRRFKETRRGLRCTL